MNAKSTPKTPVIKDWLASAGKRLQLAGINSWRLDAELILCHAVQCDRTFLHAHPEYQLKDNQLTAADVYLSQRLNRQPIAYIVGYKEFYGRQFVVTPDTLIPRPESEDLITLLSQLSLTDNLELLDVGCGSGCLGITAKLEFPKLNVSLIDVSDSALKVATLNAKNLLANVAIIKSDLLDEYPGIADIIIANLPYVDADWERSPETNHEPALALFAGNNGKALIEKLIAQTEGKLSPKGCLIIEADPEQHDPLIATAKQNNFILIDQLNYGLSFRRQY